MHSERLTSVFCDLYINDSLHTNIFQCTHKKFSIYVNVKKFHLYFSDPDHD